MQIRNEAIAKIAIDRSRSNPTASRGKMEPTREPLVLCQRRRMRQRQAVDRHQQRRACRQLHRLARLLPRQRAHQQSSHNPARSAQHADRPKLHLRVPHLPKRQRVGQRQRRHEREAVQQDKHIQRPEARLPRQPGTATPRPAHARAPAPSASRTACRQSGQRRTARPSRPPPSLPRQHQSGCPLKCSDSASHVPSVTYHAPQIKYSRNIMALSRILIDHVMPSPPRPRLLPPRPTPRRAHGFRASGRRAAPSAPPAQTCTPSLVARPASLPREPTHKYPQERW